MSTRVRDRDHGAAHLERALGELAHHGVALTIGVHEDDGAERHEGSAGATIAEVATFVELGTEEEGPRSFVRASVDEDRARLAGSLARAAQGAAEGASIPEAFGEIGRELAEAMRDCVPVQSGQLRDAISARVRGERVG